MGQLTQTTTQVQTILNNTDAANVGKTSLTDASDTTSVSLKKSGFYSLQGSSSNAPSTDRAVIISAVRDTAATGEIRYGQIVITESNGLWWNSDDGGSIGTWYETVSTAGTQTLTNKTLTSPVLTTPQINDSAADHQYVFAAANLAADRTVTLPLLTGNDTFVFEAHTQTLTNKTLTTPTVSALTLSDASIIFEGATANAYETTLTVTDPTADRTLTLPNATDTLVGRDTTDTLTNKTLTSPDVNTPDIDGGTVDNTVIGGSTAAAITGTTLVANTSINIAGDGATVTGIKDEDDMSSNSAVKLATQQSIKAYVDAQVDTADSLSEILAIGNTTGGTDISVSTDDKAQFRDSAIYINSSVDGQLDIVADTEIQIAATTVDLNGNLDVSGTALVTGVLTTTATQVATGGITSGSNILSDTDSTDSLGSTGVRWLKGWFDTLTAGTLTIGSGSVTDSSGAISFGNENLTTTGIVTAAGTSVFTNLDISGDVDVDGTLNVDAIDIDGALQLDGALTVGVDDTGYDVKFFGDTASAYMLWDTSADDLILAGAAGLTVAGDIDVDGTTNLDVVDIDGAVDMASTLAVGGLVTIPTYIDHAGDTNTYLGFPAVDNINFTTGGAERLRLTDTYTVFNDAGSDVNFMVESSGNANMLFVDGGEDAVGIGTVPLAASRLHVAGHTGSLPSIFEGSGAGDGVPLQLKVKANNGTTSTQGLYGNAGSASTDNTIVLGNSGSSGLSVASDGSVSISGALSKSSGSFKIDHPLDAKKDTHWLVHSFIEGPQADLIYRGTVTLSGGSATVNIDIVAGMTSGTFVALCGDVQCFTSNESTWDAVRGSVSGNTLTIACQNSSSTATVSWLVIGERKDPHMKLTATAWTDSDGKVIVEVEKPEE